MFSGMVYAILSTDMDFVEDMSLLLRKVGAEVYAASSWEEYARLQQEGRSGGDVRGRSGFSTMLRTHGTAGGEPPSYTTSIASGRSDLLPDEELWATPLDVAGCGISLTLGEWLS